MSNINFASPIWNIRNFGIIIIITSLNPILLNKAQENPSIHYAN